MMEAFALTQESVDLMKLGIAILAFFLFLLTWALQNKGQSRRFVKVRNTMLLVLGLAGALAWFNFGKFHFNDYRHTWELFHYYVGAKYFPELKYNQLYNAASVADFDDGLYDQVSSRSIRNLDNNAIKPSDFILADPDKYRSKFSSERWAEFQHDIRWFRGQMPSDRWDYALTDHGYNATPVWTISGNLISNLNRATDAFILGISLIDVLLFGLMWALVYWAFGWKVMCLAFIFWGGNYLARFWWTGGSFLRHDWLLWTIAGICFLKKEKNMAGGFAITLAALLRIFPGFLVLALIAKALYEMWERKKFYVSTAHRNFALGCIIALVTLVPLSIVVSGNVNVYQEFIENSTKHLSTPLTNNVGLKVLLSYDPDHIARKTIDHAAVEPYHAWKSLQLETLESRRILYYILVILFFILLIKAVKGKEDWVVATLGLGIIPFVATLTCYYYMFFVAFAFLYARHRLMGVLLSFLAVGSYLIAYAFDWYDELFTWNSLLFLYFVVVVTAIFAFSEIQIQAVLRSTER